MHALLVRANDRTKPPRGRAEAAVAYAEAVACAPAAIKRAVREASRLVSIVDAAERVDPAYRWEARSLLETIEGVAESAAEPVQGRPSGGARRNGLMPQGLLGRRGWIEHLRAGLRDARLEPAPAADPEAVRALRQAAGVASVRAILDLGGDRRITLDGETPVHGRDGLPLATAKVTGGRPGKLLRCLVGMSLQSRGLPVRDRVTLTKEEKTRAAEALRDFLQHGSPSELVFAQPVDIGPTLDTFARTHRLI